MMSVATIRMRFEALLRQGAVLEKSVRYRAGRRTKTVLKTRKRKSETALPVNRKQLFRERLILEQTDKAYEATRIEARLLRYERVLKALREQQVLESGELPARRSQRRLIGQRPQLFVV